MKSWWGAEEELMKNWWRVNKELTYPNLLVRSFWWRGGKNDRNWTFGSKVSVFGHFHHTKPCQTSPNLSQSLSQVVLMALGKKMIVIRRSDQKLSFLAIFTFTFIHSLSYFHFHTFIPSLSYFLLHTFTFTPSPSYFHCHTFILSPSYFHFHIFTFIR